MKSTGVPCLYCFWDCCWTWNLTGTFGWGEAFNCTGPPVIPERVPFMSKLQGWCVLRYLMPKCTNRPNPYLLTVMTWQINSWKQPLPWARRLQQVKLFHVCCVTYLEDFVGAWKSGVHGKAVYVVGIKWKWIQFRISAASAISLSALK